MKVRTRLSKDTVGKPFVDKDGELWRHIMYYGEPTATVERIYEPKTRKGGAVGSPILEELGLRLLVPEGEP